MHPVVSHACVLTGCRAAVERLGLHVNLQRALCSVPKQQLRGCSHRSL